jgi:hypothetical protein
MEGVRSGVQFKQDTATDTRMESGRDTEPGAVSSTPNDPGRGVVVANKAMGRHSTSPRR